ncbi:hypothetical protein SUGI_0299800 [Cryptomeria japonica]|uniref:transcription factor MYB82 n=1 Tax=Cryptomeria japonica TaxID=3369 RepID=UPI002408D0D0|nr:transcription factor MYB82 [Cryptomeria japonica]GLJ17277.1 hypothetical protein SUGI_0299800 [Cryptomeria japonica]
MVGSKCVNGLNRGTWQPNEDLLLKQYIEANGVGRWSTLPARAGLNRCGKSCRLRWLNYLRPNVKRGHISPEEEELIIRLHKLLGNRWSLIAARVPGRTDNDVKNFWNIHVSKKSPNKRLHLKAPRSQVKDESSTESEQLKYACNGKPAEMHTAVYETRVVEQNSHGIQSNICESIQGATTSNQYHSDLDPFWVGSVPWLHSNDGDKFYVFDNTCYFTDSQQNNLISHLDLKGMWCNNIF